MTTLTPQLYLIPCGLSTETAPELYLSANTIEIIRQLKVFIVENEKSARAFLKQCAIETPQAELTIFELDKHDSKQNINSFLDPLKNKVPTGLLSEAGCPAVADPGARIVAAAHKANIKVKPLIGPSSILLALMASGLEGQRFCFHGYLPIDRSERIKSLQQLERSAQQRNETQIFIEAPYRNNPMLKDILSSCNNETRLCIASNIDTNEESIRTLRVQEWKKQIPELHKIPVVFLIL
jgi:16S rRNA (cytidine1402-2'-O)-methyltransferase